MKIGMEFTAAVDGFGIDAVGVCRPEGFTVFVEGALPGEFIRARICEKKKRFAKAVLIEVIKESPLRAAPPCPIYNQCGGCCAQHMTYEAGTEMKREQVIRAFLHIAGYSKDLLEKIVKPVIKMDKPFRYRNKAEFAVTDSLPLIGYHKKNSHQIIAVPDCLLLHPSALQIKKAIGTWLASVHDADIRKIIARVNEAGDSMAVIEGNISARHAVELTERLRREVDGLTGVALLDGRALYGRPYLTESLLGLEFRISPGAFFQVNHGQAERLFDTALNFADLTGRETVIDAYCGTGVLTLAAARVARRATGIELNPDSISNAIENAERNNITNASFITGAVEHELPKYLCESPDVIFLDPPRKGCDPAVISAVLEAGPGRIVYVSCNPSTLARDVHMLSGAYELVSCVPVDMFGWTGHVEVCCSLKKT